MLKNIVCGDASAYVHWILFGDDAGGLPANDNSGLAAMAGIYSNQNLEPKD